jgi:hypothetical protein
MHKEKINKSTVGIVFLLVLVLAGGLLVEFVFAYDACGGDTMWPTVGGYITDTSGHPIRGVNMTAYSVTQYSGSATTSYIGGYLIGLVIPTTPATVNLTATKNGISTSTTFQISCDQHLEKNMTLNIETDITLNSSDISFNPALPTEFQLLTISAIIHNAGNSSVGAEGVEGLNVSFYKDNLSNLIGTDMIELAAHTQNTASINWTAEIGNHTIIVVTDADLQIYETNETNNQANKTIHIMSNEDFIKQDKVIFRYLYIDDIASDSYNESERGFNYLSELEYIFGDRIAVETREAVIGDEWMEIACEHIPGCGSRIPLTMSIGKKSMNATGGIDYDKANYTENFNETDNKTLKQWIKNICYQFEVKPDVCLPCDLNHDGLVIKDYGELMAEYKCFLGISSNCRDLNGDGITFQDWSEIKHEYECFNGLAYFSNIK